MAEDVGEPDGQLEVVRLAFQLQAYNRGVRSPLRPPPSTARVDIGSPDSIRAPTVITGARREPLTTPCAEFSVSG